MTGFVDMLLPYYQQICERAGLPCYATMQQIEITTDKIKFKNLCRNFDVPVVEEYELSQRANFTYPLILKPIDNSGGRGVTICKNADEFDIAYSNALSFSPSKHVLIERYMTSKEVSLFYIAIDGEIHLTAMGNRYVKHSEIKGVEQIRALPGVIDLIFTYLAGEEIPQKAVGTLAQVILRVFIVSETKEQLKQTMDEVHRSIEIHSTTGEDMLLPTFDTHEL